MPREKRIPVFTTRPVYLTRDMVAIVFEFTPIAHYSTREAPTKKRKPKRKAR